MSLTRLLTALALASALLVSTGPVPAHAGNAEYGRTWRGDGVLRDGCQNYYFRYRMRPGNVIPGNDWAAEITLRNRFGKGLGTVILDGDRDPKKGRRFYKICQETTSPGRFTIRGKLSVYNGDDPVQEVWIKRTTFRLRAG